MACMPAAAIARSGAPDDVLASLTGCRILLADHDELEGQLTGSRGTAIAATTGQPSMVWGTETIWGMRASKVVRAYEAGPAEAGRPTLRRDGLPMGRDRLAVAQDAAGSVTGGLARRGRPLVPAIEMRRPAAGCGGTGLLRVAVARLVAIEADVIGVVPGSIVRDEVGSVVFQLAVAGGNLFRSHRQPSHRGRGAIADDLT